jgi:hypothetical protein
MFLGHVTAQAVIHQLLEAEALVRNQAISYGFCNEQSDTKTGLSPSTSVFPLLISFRQFSIFIYSFIHPSIQHRRYIIAVADTKETFLTCHMYDCVSIPHRVLNCPMLVFVYHHAQVGSLPRSIVVTGCSWAQSPGEVSKD